MSNNKEVFLNRKIVEAALILKQITGEEIQIVPFGVNLKHTYCGNLANNVLKDIDKELFFRDLSKGDGGELNNSPGSAPKFSSISSSSALTVNSFALWKRHISQLDIKTEKQRFSGFKSMEFEHIAQNGIARTRVYPNLDVWLEYEGGVLAVECKFCEFLSGNSIKDTFSKQYDDLVISKNLRSSSWVQAMKYVMDSQGKCKFKYFNAVQIIKHYFGLIHSTEVEKHLLYLYWHPDNDDWEKLQPYKQHNDELREFASLVEDSNDVHFHHLGFNELWNQWSDYSDPNIQKHVSLLREKYSIHLMIGVSKGGLS